MTDGDEENVVDLKLEAIKRIAEDLRAMRERVDDVAVEVKAFRGEMHTRFTRVDARFDSIERNAAILADIVGREREYARGRFDRLESTVMAGFDGVHGRFESLERRVTALEARRRR